MTQSVELVLDDELDAAVRREWGALVAADLPSQARHTGATNRPHITLTAAGSVLPYLETALTSALTGRVPLSLRLGGLICFPASGGKQVLARAVVPSLELLEVQAVCADLFSVLPGVGGYLLPGAWTPHVTLARNLTAEQVGTALTALAEAAEGGRVSELHGRATGIRRWNSETRTVWALA